MTEAEALKLAIEHIEHMSKWIGERNKTAKWSNEIYSFESLGEDMPGIKTALETTPETARLQAWVNDLQSGMFINCVYCGHRYGPKDEVPASMADVLKAHVEQCPKHPMSALKEENVRLREALAPLAALDVPKKPQGNAGAYSIRFSDIARAQKVGGRS